MKRRRKHPALPPGPWIDTFRAYLAANGIRFPEAAHRHVETHVLWHVNALLIDPRLDSRGRAAVSDVFLRIGPCSHPGEPPQPVAKKEKRHEKEEVRAPQP